MWLLLGLASAAFGPGVLGTFVLDDFALSTISHATRPLTGLTFLLPHNAGLHHGINIVLHLLSVAVAFRVFPLLLPERAALIATGLFAVHPAMGESVNYIWARATLLMTLFCLLCLDAWLKQKPWLATAFFVLALLSKTECAALPIVLSLLRRDRRPVALMLACSLTAGAAVAYIASTTPGSQAGAQSAYTTLEYLSAQGSAIARYLRLYVFPYGFSIDPSVSLDVGMWLVVAAAAALRNRWLLFGLIVLLPSSSIFPADDLAADRRMYLPGVFFAAAAAQYLQRIPASVIVLAVLTFASLQRTLLWNDPAGLWADAVHRAPELVRPRVWLARVGPADEARHHLLHAQ
ncbi:MAG TPA: hypothetical protein VES20_21685, partial [Bryobacteraceae bacterium]|nr:hypothetical protein [Bryobacteraceae bacterium]